MPTETIEPFAADAPFRFVGGHPGADFVNTVDWLDAGGVGRDRLTEFARLVEWAEGARIVGAGAGARLRRAAADRPVDAAAALDAARRTRAVIRRVLAAVAAGSLDQTVAADFDALVADAAPHLRVALPRTSGEPPKGPALRWLWAGADERLDSVLWPVVWSTAQLLTSPDAARLRVCAGPDCGWVYVDRSRNGFRRWCEMSTCGTQQKSRKRAAARAAARGPSPSTTRAKGQTYQPEEQQG